MTSDYRYPAFGRAVSIRRDQLKMTQADLAARVGMSRASIANIEAGRQSVLLHHACNIATALGLATVADLLPATGKATLEDQALALSDDLSARAKAQISDLVAGALATAKAKR
ncbi:helix-turn-helix transcriptional regulator [Mesorhizobium sp. WSM3876]|uniref:helix-turn-helix transcriptional regulator n=1 Tax=Mesorhizobium sp. WSM3876 TaxID=422277 RepID=UPI000BB052AE|nr:helix-turn-helix transcriptional regulator [Mesorhizobium sp. WSM3876]PBB84540.1 transcriptional regulator [Mesorhizobium sp. WSM3876]